MVKGTFINIAQLSTGFVEVPHQITLNIYAQGCEMRCSDCQNQHLQSFDGGEKIYLTDVPTILKNYPICKWVCWLGGDAIYQPEALIAFNAEFKKCDMKVCLYTGKTLKEINKMDPVLLENVDMLVDGPWLGKPINDPDTNQKIWIADSNPDRWTNYSWDELQKEFKYLNRRLQC